MRRYVDSQTDYCKGYRILLLCLLMVYAKADVFAEQNPVAVEQSDKKESSFERGLNVGYNFKYTDLKIMGQQERELARFRQFNHSPLVEYSTGDILHRFNRLSLNILLGYGQFELDRQVVNGESVDLGSSIKARYSYLMPVIHYNFNPVFPEPYRYNGVRISIGLGLGHISVIGTAVNTAGSGSKPETVYYDYTTSNSMLAVSYHSHGLVTRLRYFNQEDLAFDTPHEVRSAELIADMSYLLHF